MKKVKYPEIAPWDGGPNQIHESNDEWVMQKGIIEVIFSRNKLDSNYFHIRRGEKEEQVFTFQARYLYQELVDKGFVLQGKIDP